MHPAHKEKTIRDRPGRENVSLDIRVLSIRFVDGRNGWEKTLVETEHSTPFLLTRKGGLRKSISFWQGQNPIDWVLLPSDGYR